MFIIKYTIIQNILFYFENIEQNKISDFFQRRHFHNPIIANWFSWIPNVHF